MTVFGYIRVSTAEQASNGDSLETQRRQIEAWAMLQGWQMGEIFVEGGVSGSVPLSERAEGRRLIAIAARGDVIITPKLDRMFRSASDALGTLEVLKAEGIGLVIIDLGGDVTSNGVSKLVFTILSAVAENERESTRERIREVKRHLATQGIYAGGKAPFGFDAAEGGKLVPNADEQMDLQLMQALRNRGESYRAIGDAVDRKAMTVKRVLDRTATGESEMTNAELTSLLEAMINPTPKGQGPSDRILAILRQHARQGNLADMATAFVAYTAARPGSTNFVAGRVPAILLNYVLLKESGATISDWMKWEKANPKWSKGAIDHLHDPERFADYVYGLVRDLLRQRSQNTAH